MNLKCVSEDDRRRLFEFGEGGIWKVCKYIEVKEDCIIGNHLHNKKDELFLILKGEIEYTLDYIGVLIEGFTTAIDTIYVPRNTFHSFRCKAGTTLVCLATELHDNNDDIKDKA